MCSLMLLLIICIHFQMMEQQFIAVAMVILVIIMYIAPIASQDPYVTVQQLSEFKNEMEQELKEVEKARVQSYIDERYDRIIGINDIRDKIHNDRGECITRIQVLVEKSADFTVLNSTVNVLSTIQSSK